MDLKKLKSFKDFRILLIPEKAEATRSTKFTAKQFFIIAGAYTFVIALAGFIFFNITPLGDLIFPKSSSLSNEEINKINQLNERLYFLTKELESLKSANERLKYAIILGDSTLLDSLEKKNENKNEKKIKADGNLLGIIKQIFSSEKKEQAEEKFFLKPVNGFVSREFFPDKGHLGIDWVVKTGTPVYSSASGFVIFSGYTVKDGYMLIINHSNDYISIYKHCSSLLKKEREIVMQGELVALSGNSGEITTGPHLHFEIWKNGIPIDPKTVIINY